MSGAGGESPIDASYLHWVEFSDHHPRHNEETQSATCLEDEDAGHGNPGVGGFDAQEIPCVFFFHVDAKTDHCDATANKGDE